MGWSLRSSPTPAEKMWRQKAEQARENEKDDIKICVCCLSLSLSLSLSLFLSLSLSHSIYKLINLFIFSRRFISLSIDSFFIRCFPSLRRLPIGVVTNKPLHYRTKTVFCVFVIFSHVKLQRRSDCNSRRTATLIDMLEPFMWCCSSTRVWWKLWQCKHLFGVVVLQTSISEW